MKTQHDDISKGGYENVIKRLEKRDREGIQEEEKMC